jgi:hypothetical protein
VWDGGQDRGTANCDRVCSGLQQYLEAAVHLLALAWISLLRLAWLCYDTA